MDILHCTLLLRKDTAMQSGHFLMLQVMSGKLCSGCKPMKEILHFTLLLGMDTAMHSGHFLMLQAMSRGPGGKFQTNLGSPCVFATQHELNVWRNAFRI